MCGYAYTVQNQRASGFYLPPFPDKKYIWMLTGDFVSSSRETGPSQRRESGHAPGVGPNPSGAQQSIETSSELYEGQPKAQSNTKTGLISHPKLPAYALTDGIVMKHQQ